MDESEANHEVEAKFSISLPEAAQRLRTASRLARGFKLGDSSQVTHTDTYYDTTDFYLLRHGHTLRLRHDPARATHGVTVGYKSIDLKTPRGLHARKEIETPASDLAAAPLLLQRSDLPDAIADALDDAFASGEPLHPVCQLVQQRTKRAVLRARGAAPLFGELSIDEVQVMRAPAAEDALWEAVGSFTEAELELVGEAAQESNARDELRRIAGELREAEGITPNDQNKMQQALVQIADAQTPATFEEAGRQHTAELCRRIWRQQLVEMLVNEAGVRESDDIEYVHAMRVATRRARAAGRLYATWFDAPKQSSRFARRLRDTGRALGGVRDMDVALDNLDSETASSATNTKKPSPLAQHWRDKRDKAHRKLLTWLDSPKYTNFITEFSAFCSTPGTGIAALQHAVDEPPPPFQVRHTLPSMIWTRFEAVRAFEALFDDADQTPVPIETLHALRIECKYLRYHLEFAEPVLGSDGSELITAIKALQEQLGKLNDAAVASDLIKQSSAARKAKRTAAHLARQKEIIEELRQVVPAAFAAFVAYENRLHLALALAKL